MGVYELSVMSEAQQSTAEVRTEGTAQMITVSHDVDGGLWSTAMKKAAEENDDPPRVRNQHYTFEKVREFADSTLFAVWDSRQ